MLIGRAAKIFIVEDEAITVKALEKSLISLGYNVVGNASSGEVAMTKIAETRPDLVLMDIRLSGVMDGISTAQRVRARFDIPVIYLTALSDEETLKRVLHSKPYGYIVKPFDEQSLHIAVERALHQHAMVAEARSR